MQVKNSSFEYAGGCVAVNINISQLEADKMLVYNKIKFDDIDLSKIDINKLFLLGNMSIVGSSALGKVSGVVKASLIADTLLVIDQQSLDAEVEMALVDGELINFTPLKAVSEYFSVDDLMHIKFDTIYNKYSIKSGVVTVPKMNIASTLGNYFIMGSYAIDGKLDLEVDIPLNVIAKAAVRKMTNGAGIKHKPKEIDGRVRDNYLKFYIRGKKDNLEVSLRDND